MIPGSACTQNIFRLAVSPPNTPAATTQPRKKILIASPDAPSTSPQPRPTAMKPLYRPWLAASARVAVANSGVSPKVFIPKGLVQRNISRTRKYKCSRATSATATSATASMGPPSVGKYIGVGSRLCSRERRLRHAHQEDSDRRRFRHRPAVPDRDPRQEGLRMRHRAERRRGYRQGEVREAGP